MGTTSNASSLASVTAPLYFTGVSSFSTDFQSIIQRAVQIADIPVTNLQNQQTTVTSKEQALTALEPGVSALGADIAALGTLANTLGLSASSSDSTIVSAVNTGATAPASYTVSNITSLASAASETSLVGYTATQAVSASGLVNLVVGSHSYRIDLTGAGQNNVAGLANAINNAHAGVSASILSSGSTRYLTVSSNSTGATTLQVNNVTPVDLISSHGTGSEASWQTYADTIVAPVSANGQLQLVVGSNTFSLALSGGNNNLNGLVNAINGANAGVTASIAGSPGAFYLSLTHSGPISMQLNDLQNPSNLVSGTNQGTNASFTLNGVPITESTNNITDVVPGMTFKLLNKTTGPGSVTLSLATNPSQLSSALQTMVTDYNTLVSQVKTQQGQNAGPLQGDLIVSQISRDMQNLVTYWNPTGTSTIHSLSDLGITFDYSGQMSFSANTFNALSDNQISDAFKFLGSANSGFAALAGNFSQLSDPISGLIQTQISGYQRENTNLGNQITTAQDRVARVQKSVTAQVQIADALVAQLQSQQNTLGGSIQSLNYTLYGKLTNANGL